MPPGHFLLVNGRHPFRASISEAGTAMAVEESLTEAGGNAFVLFRPLPVAGRHKPRTLKLSCYDPDGCTHHCVNGICCPVPGKTLTPERWSTDQVYGHAQPGIGEPLAMH